MNVEKILSDRNIFYKHRGQDLLINCLNPEHEDSNPSMSISSVTGVFHCFSCGFKGDIFGYYNLTKDITSIKIAELKDKIQGLYKITPQNYPIGHDFITSEFRGISAKTLQEFSAFTCSQADWEGRIWFPVRDIFKNIVCFQGRFMYTELSPKYIFFPRNIPPPLIPASPDTESGKLLLVEGIFDLLNLWDNGVKNVICTFGTGIGSKKQIKRLEPYKIMGISTIIPLFDNDIAGIKAVKELEYNNKTFLIEKYELPEGKDPGSLTRDEIFDLKRSLSL